MEKKFEEILKLAGAILFGVMVVLAAFAVFWRTIADLVPAVDSASLYWVNEAQQLMLHWLIVTGLVLAFLHCSQLNITLFYGKAGPKTKFILDRLFNMIHIAVYGVILIWGFRLAVTEVKTRTPALEWSRGIFVYFPYVLLSLFIVLHQIWDCFLQIFRRKGGG